MPSARHEVLVHTAWWSRQWRAARVGAARRAQPRGMHQRQRQHGGWRRQWRARATPWQACSPAASPMRTGGWGACLARAQRRRCPLTTAGRGGKRGAGQGERDVRETGGRCGQVLLPHSVYDFVYKQVYHIIKANTPGAQPAPCCQRTSAGCCCVMQCTLPALSSTSRLSTLTVRVLGSRYLLRGRRRRAGGQGGRQAGREPGWQWAMQRSERPPARRTALHSLAVRLAQDVQRALVRHGGARAKAGQHRAAVCLVVVDVGGGQALAGDAGREALVIMVGL